MRFMKELFEILSKDIMSENFTRREFIIYGIVYPLGLIAACVLAEIVSNL